MNPRIARAAWVGLILMLAGWIVAVLGFLPGEVGSPATSPWLHQAIRVLGFILLVMGSTIAVFATVGTPVLVIVAGVGLNLAHQADLIIQESMGIAGAGLVLLGTLWGSRRIRQPPVDRRD